VLCQQVWCRELSNEAAGSQQPVQAGVSAAAGDVLLGCAAVDLSMLSVLGKVDGWYNVTDGQQQPRGQLQVMVCWTLAAARIF
jgi:hypothetical protein